MNPARDAASAEPPIIIPPRVIKRGRATRAEMERRRQDLHEIVVAIRPMTVRQVFYQVTVRGIVDWTEAGYAKVKTDFADMRRAGRLPYSWLRGLAPQAEIHCERLDVLPEQIQVWSPPTKPTNSTDTRARGFGDISFKLDAIEPGQLRATVQTAVERHLPAEQLRALQVAEASERDTLRGLVERLRGDDLLAAPQ